MRVAPALAYSPLVEMPAVFAPGAIGDHLTSCAGQIPDPCLGQSSVWDWMRLGATASYGTVSEPCSFEVKFPDPMVAFWYARGFSAGEALAMSVRNPYQGIWVGDPLAAPFAAPPAVRIDSPARNAELDGIGRLAQQVTDAGIAWIACATTLSEARAAQDAGADAVVAQGVEAGGHRGAFDPAMMGWTLVIMRPS